ncbi:MAG: carotenoid biosynthesis protein [Actinomycetota bacterium]
MIVLSTIARRWYAFAFVALLVWSASQEQGGWKRAVRFLAISFCVQLAAELSSTRNGFPFGRYDYIAPTHGDELYISDVPLFVPLSFGSVVWAARAYAVAAFRAAGARLVIAGAATAAVIDAVIDPMTLQGDTWFLGPLYAYRKPGWFFDVPWTNFAGWIASAALILAIDEAFHTSPASPSLRSLAVPFSILAFFVTLALATGHPAVAAFGFVVTAAFVAGIQARRMEHRMP